MNQKEFKSIDKPFKNNSIKNINKSDKDNNSFSLIDQTLPKINGYVELDKKSSMLPIESERKCNYNLNSNSDRGKNKNDNSLSCQNLNLIYSPINSKNKSINVKKFENDLPRNFNLALDQIGIISYSKEMKSSNIKRLKIA